jgi:hypothetical protein
MAINYEFDRAITQAQTDTAREFLRAQKVIFNAAVTAGIVEDLPLENVTPEVVDQTVIKKESPKRKKRISEPEGFLTNVSRDEMHHYPDGDRIDFSYYHYKALKELGFDIRFEDGAKTLDDVPLPQCLRAVADSPETKEKINQIDKYLIHDERYQPQNPLHAGLPHNTSEDGVLTQYINVFTNILADNPDLKPQTQ